MMLALFVSPLAAQEVTTLFGTVVEEAEPDRTLISKPGWLRGLHLVGDPLASDQRPQISATLPQDWLGQTVCARITTIKGDYNAVVQYEIPDRLDSERVRLDFETAYRGIIADITPDNSGIALERGPCRGDGAEDAREYAANFWNEAAGGREGDLELLLNMNVARADELLSRAWLDDAEELDAACHKITSPEALAFNYRCRVALPRDKLLPNRDLRVTFAYARLYRGRESSERRATVLIGAEP